MTTNPHCRPVSPFEAPLGFRFAMDERGEPRAQYGHDGQFYVSALGDTLERWCNERDFALDRIHEIDAVLTGTAQEFRMHCDDSLVVADAQRFTSRWSLRGMNDVENEGTTTELRELLVGWLQWCDTHVLWRFPQRVVLKKDYFSSPVWDAVGARAGIDYQDIPIGPALELRLTTWSDTFDATFDLEEGRNSGFHDDAELAAFDAESMALAEAMRTELGDAYRVDRVSYLAGTIEPDPRGPCPVPAPSPLAQHEVAGGHWRTRLLRWSGRTRR